jgi:hypothetical protein
MTAKIKITKEETLNQLLGEIQATESELDIEYKRHSKVIDRIHGLAVDEDELEEKTKEGFETIDDFLKTAEKLQEIKAQLEKECAEEKEISKNIKELEYSLKESKDEYEEACEGQAYHFLTADINKAVTIAKLEALELFISHLSGWEEDERPDLTGDAYKSLEKALKECRKTRHSLKLASLFKLTPEEARIMILMQGKSRAHQIDMSEEFDAVEDYTYNGDLVELAHLFILEFVIMPFIEEKLRYISLLSIENGIDTIEHIHLAGMNMHDVPQSGEHYVYADEFLTVVEPDSEEDITVSIRF